LPQSVYCKGMKAGAGQLDMASDMDMLSQLCM